MTDEFNKDRLGKIVAIAKNGVGGEKENAIRILKALCKKHELDFDEVMSDAMNVREFLIPYKKESDIQIIWQIISAYSENGGETSKLSYNHVRKVIFVKATVEEYAEIMNAVAVLLPLYYEEMKVAKLAAMHAFLGKHDLYYKPKSKEEYDRLLKKQEETKEEKKARAMGHSMQRHYDDAHIRKSLQEKN